MNFAYISYRRPKAIIRMRDLLNAVYASDMAQERRVQYASDLDVLHNTANEISVLIAFRMLSLLSAKGTNRKQCKKLVRKDNAENVNNFLRKFIGRIKRGKTFIRSGNTLPKLRIIPKKLFAKSTFGKRFIRRKGSRSSLSSVSEFRCINSIGRTRNKRRCSIMSRGSYKVPMRLYFPMIMRDSLKSRIKYRACCRNIRSLMGNIRSIGLYKLHTLRQISMDRCGSIFHQSSDRAKSIMSKYSVIYGFPLM